MKNLKITNPFSLDSKKQAKLLKLVESISKHKKLATGGGKESFYALTLKLTNLIFNSNPEIGDVIADGVNFATVTGIDDNGDARLWEGVLTGDELQTRVETFNKGYLTYNYIVVGVISPADFKFDLNNFEVIKSNDVASKLFKSKKSKKVKTVAKTDDEYQWGNNDPLNPKHTSHLTNVKLICEVEEVVEPTLPTIEELEERINDLPKGRGYANLGKKYKHSGARIEEFKIGKVKVKKGDKLFFKIGKTEVSGIFSHLNQCIHCPEGYVVVKFEGKNYERRQSRVSLTSAE